MHQPASASDQPPIVYTNGNLCLVTGVESLSYGKGSLRHLSTKVGLGDACKFVIPVFLSEDGRRTMAVRSRSQVKECIVSYFRDWLDDVDTKHCVFVVSPKPIQLRPTTTSDTDGGLLAKPQQVTLRSLFRELFPHADVYEPASTQQASAPGRGPSSVDLTVGFQTVLHDLLPPGSHFVVVPNFFSETLVAKAPDGVLPEGKSLVIVQNSVAPLYPLGDRQQTLNPYKVLEESAELHIRRNPFPPGLLWYALNAEGQMFSPEAITASLSIGALRLTRSDTHYVIGIGEPDFDASSLLQDVDDDASTELGALGRTRPWADAFGPDGESLAANIASLVEKTRRVSDFAKATFSTSEKQDTPVTTDNTTPAHRICDFLARQLCTQLRVDIHNSTASMTGEQDAGGRLDYPASARVASMQ